MCGMLVCGSVSCYVLWSVQNAVYPELTVTIFIDQSKSIVSNALDVYLNDLSTELTMNKFFFLQNAIYFTVERYRECTLTDTQ